MSTDPAEPSVDPKWEAFQRQVGALQAEANFGDARRLLDRARIEPFDGATAAEGTWVLQQLALCTFSDEELPLTQRLDDAEALLNGLGLRDPTTHNGETLALGGAVCARRWEATGQIESLHESLAFSRAAWDRGDRDASRVSAAVNAAFLDDVLASRARHIAQRTGTSGVSPAVYEQQADELRRAALALAEQMLERDPTLARAYDHQVTLAELYLGIGRTEPARYAQAEAAFRRAAEAAPADWQLQATFHQVNALLRSQGIQAPSSVEKGEALAPPWRAVASLIGPDALGSLATHRGKVGLALSGGGFRASLFHLGALARLAEVDALRSIEVISTVSGGSIVGAHYYLEVQRLLEMKADRDITAADYIDIVRRVQGHFLAGVQKNIRMRALGNLIANLRVAFGSSYTYSRRLGELYERLLYAQVDDGRGGAARKMSDLLIQPKDAKAPFKPKHSNFRRRTKVPIVLINATSLNSGHNWQFTARSMGEPPGRLNTDVDANLRYRRLWYDQAPLEEHRHFRLGHAVAASACVPGLFEPIVLKNLYAGRTVRLADGGVNDNQGVGGLLDEGCGLLLVSDASGQMGDLEDPPNGRLGVPLRSNSILMDRVREAEYEDLENRVESHALQGVLYVHLKQELGVRPLDWIGCDDPTPESPAEPLITRYGIDKQLQRQLAEIRTDLDSFTDVEAYALMLSGYRMTARRLLDLELDHSRSGAAGRWGELDAAAPAQDWEFLKLGEVMGESAASNDRRRLELGRQLAVSRALLFKAWRLNRPLLVLGIVLAVVAVALGGVELWQRWNDSTTITVGKAAIWIGLGLAAVVIPGTGWLRPESKLREFAVKLAIAFLAFALAVLHLALIERFFLRAGRLERLLKLR